MPRFGEVIHMYTPYGEQDKYKVDIDYDSTITVREMERTVTDGGVLIESVVRTFVIGNDLAGRIAKEYEGYRYPPTGRSG